ncbi:hypothetical protein TNCV_3559981 [Trichonephila clavipes]|uniref:Uncharacterized protein n=1 Tax=Trichonephila clavipes TaxID=2585209 RepID=A0A8X7BIH3_TRICX|nr:hypothetical protein TNCV_3559981 [Trichonephila clavipes]
MEQHVLETILRIPSTSVHAVAAAAGGSQSRVRRFFNSKVYNNTIFKEYDHCFPQIICAPQIISNLHGGFSTNVTKKCLSHPTFYLRLSMRISRNGGNFEYLL